MRVLVTGGTGFIGSKLLECLKGSEYDVYSLVRYAAGRLAGIQTVFADLRDAFQIRNVISHIQPSKVVHLAAITPVSYSFDHPQEVLETNLMGTVNLAEACLRLVPHFKQFLFAGTSEEYGDQDVFPIKEEAPLRAVHPYALSKIAADMYLQYMWKAYDFPVTVLRPFNSYGRTDNKHFIVEKAVTQMLEERGQVCLGDPDPIRDFLYVDDHVRGYLLALAVEEAVGETLNLCTGIGINIKNLVDKIAELTEFKGEIVWHTVPHRPLDIQTLIGNNTRAGKVLGWKPQTSLEEGLKLAIEYWRNR